jgi:hypothetical protein
MFCCLPGKYCAGAFCLHLEDGIESVLGIVCPENLKVEQQATTQHLYLNNNPLGITYWKTVVFRFTVIPCNATCVVSWLISLGKRISYLC